MHFLHFCSSVFGFERIKKTYRNGIFKADDDTNIREQENSDNQYISQYYLEIILVECVYQTPVTIICNGGKISYILTNFILNTSALNSKHFTY